MEDFIFVNEKTNQIVPENYPDAVKYIKAEGRKIPIIGDILADDEGFMATVLEIEKKDDEGNYTIAVFNYVDSKTGESVIGSSRQMKNAEVATHEQKVRYFEIMKSLTRKGGKE